MIISKKPRNKALIHIHSRKQKYKCQSRTLSAERPSLSSQPRAYSVLNSLLQFFHQFPNLRSQRFLIHLLLPLCSPDLSFLCCPPLKHVSPSRCIGYAKLTAGLRVVRDDPFKVLDAVGLGFQFDIRIGGEVAAKAGGEVVVVAAVMVVAFVPILVAAADRASTKA